MDQTISENKQQMMKIFMLTGGGVFVLVYLKEYCDKLYLP